MVSKITNSYLGTDIALVLTHNSSVHKNALHDLAFIEILIARFVGAEAF